MGNYSGKRKKAQRGVSLRTWNGIPMRLVYSRVLLSPCFSERPTLAELKPVSPPRKL